MSLDGVTGGPRDALRSKSIWTDEDGVRRVKQDGGVRGLAETGHASTPRWSRGDQGKMNVWVVWASKPPRRQISWFGPEN
jgi:hypothetical protein